MTPTAEETGLQLYNNNAEPPATAAPGRTLLPGAIASIVSTLTGASSLSIKIGSKIGGFWIAGARETTLTGLELTRAALETILNHAGRDVASRATGEMGRREAESVLEKSIAALHSGLSTMSFIASSGFYLSSATLNSASDLSIQGLSTLNAILGSTESSRAVAAIITLLREEMNKMPDGSRQGEIVGYSDLLIGTVGFVLLQRWGRRKTERDFRDRGGEETIWDTVIDDKGFRADVVGTRRREEFAGPENGRMRRSVSFVSPTGDEAIEALERGTLHDIPSLSMSPEDQTRLSDEEIKAHIISQLPLGARATITSETITAKTITVQIYDADTTHVEAPPGTIMVAERLNYSDGSGDSDVYGTPHQTVVFRTALKRSSSAEIEFGAEKLRLTGSNVEHDTADSGDDLMMQGSATSKRKPVQIHQNPSVGAEEIDFEETGAANTSLPSSGPIANQKRTRRPDGPTMAQSQSGRLSVAGNSKDKAKSTGKNEKNGAFKKALKSLSPSQSSTAVKDIANTTTKGSRATPPSRSFSSTIPRMMAAPSKDAYSSKPLPDPQSKRANGVRAQPHMLSPPIPRSSPGQNFFTVHEQRRDSLVSQTDTYSTHSIESRPGSPTFTRTHTRTTSGLAKTKSDMDMAVWNTTEDRPTSAGRRHHQRSKSFVPSLYSMTTKNSEESIILAPKTPLPRASIFEDSAILTALVLDGKVPGMFPSEHLVRTVRRFARFSSASYGSNFLRVMGLTSSDMNQSTELQKVDIHHEHSSFSTHTGLPPDTILLSSFVDPQGMSGNTEWSASAISPLIHYISIDHDSKAVVLTCRGTLGFEDILTDMTCDYDDLYWQGRPYKVHKGIHASARRMLGGRGSRVMATIKATLEEYPDFGLVLCGHSLGGAVAAVLAILISEQSPPGSTGTAFVTSTVMPKLLIASRAHDPIYHTAPITLPANRAIHVYSFGTPACVSENLRLATRGLITSVINHSDFFPSLSIGTLHDFRGVALSLKTDTTGAYNNLKARVWARFKYACQNVFYVDPGPPPAENLAGDGMGEDNWAWAALKTLRAGMTSDKLVPAGEVFVVETTRVFDRQTDSSLATGDSATERVYRSLGRPATRVQFKLIRDVQGRFGELRFGSDMFGDHNPGRYEANLAALERGILDV